MFINVDHDTGKSCYDAVREVFAKIKVGDSVTIDGMMMGDRTIELDVVKALVQEVCNDCRKMLRCIDTKSDSGWANKITVVCTGSM